MMSQPASACTSGLPHQGRQRLVVDDLAAAHQAVVAVAGVGIERHVEQHADVEAGLADGARGPADEVVGIVRLAAVVGAQLRVGVGKQRHGRNAQRDGLLGCGHREVDAQAIDARHGRHRHALVAALDDEDRPDQIGGRQRVLGHQPSRPAGLAVAPHAYGGETSGRRQRWGSTAGPAVIAGTSGSNRLHGHTFSELRASRPIRISRDRSMDRSGPIVRKRRHKARGPALLANALLADYEAPAVGHVDVEVVLVGVVGLGAEHGAENLAGRAMRPAQEVHLAVQRGRDWVRPAAWGRPGDWAASARHCRRPRAGGCPASGSICRGWQCRCGRDLRPPGGRRRGACRRSPSACPCLRSGRRSWPGRSLRAALVSGGLGGDLACRHAPVGDHAGGLPARGHERPDVEGIDPAVLAEPALGAAVGVAAGIGTHGVDAGERAAQVLARQRLQVLLHPFVHRHDHVAGQIDGRRQHDLLLGLADADQLHRCGRAALGSLAPGRGVNRHHIQALQQDRAARLRQLDLMRRTTPACLAAGCRRSAPAAQCWQAATVSQAVCCAHTLPAASTHNAAVVAKRRGIINDLPLLPAPGPADYAPTNRNPEVADLKQIYIAPICGKREAFASREAADGDNVWMKLGWTRSK